MSDATIQSAREHGWPAEELGDEACDAELEPIERALEQIAARMRELLADEPIVDFDYFNYKRLPFEDLGRSEDRPLSSSAAPA